MSHSEHQHQNEEDGSLFSHLRRTAEIESDREALAQLANKRAELKFALDKISELELLNIKKKQSSTSTSTSTSMSVSETECESESESTSSATSSNKDGNDKKDQDEEENDDDDDDDGMLFMATSNSSFFKMCPEDSEKILRVLLEEVEKEIVTICNEAQRKLHTHTHRNK